MLFWQRLQWLLASLSVIVDIVSCCRHCQLLPSLLSVVVGILVSCCQQCQLLSSSLSVVVDIVSCCQQCQLLLTLSAVINIVSCCWHCQLLSSLSVVVVMIVIPGRHCQLLLWLSVIVSHPLHKTDKYLDIQQTCWTFEMWMKTITYYLNVWFTMVQKFCQ